MSTFDPVMHHRRSIRLIGYDYTSEGAYFITACVRDRECMLGAVRNGETELLALGEIVARSWDQLPQVFPSVKLDAFIVMPNHFHGIIVVTDFAGATSHKDSMRVLAVAQVDADDVGATLAVAHTDADDVGATLAVAHTDADDVGATLAVAQSGAIAQDQDRAGARPAPTKPKLGDVVGAFKSSCVTEWLRYIKRNNLNAVGKFWQRNYYEHIVRDESDLDRIREYIAMNPVRWELDRENPHRRACLHDWSVDENRWFGRVSL
jgi:putative transposase